MRAALGKLPQERMRAVAAVLKSSLERVNRYKLSKVKRSVEWPRYIIDLEELKTLFNPGSPSCEQLEDATKPVEMDNSKVPPVDPVADAPHEQVGLKIICVTRYCNIRNVSRNFPVTTAPIIAAKASLMPGQTPLATPQSHWPLLMI